MAAVNTTPFDVKFESIDTGRYRVFIVSNTTPSLNDSIIVGITPVVYTFPNTLEFKNEILFRAIAIDAVGNPLGVAYQAWGLKSVYDSARDREELIITQYLVNKNTSELLLPGTTSTKAITSDRTFTIPLKLNFIDNFNPGGLNLSFSYDEMQAALNSTLYGVDFGTSFDQLFNQQFNVVPTTEGGGGTVIYQTPEYNFVLPELPGITPAITTPVTSTTEFTATISWTSNYPGDGRVIFVGDNCPEVINADGTRTKQCQTIPKPLDYKNPTVADPLINTHSFSFNDLYPGTSYTFYVESRVILSTGEKILKSDNITIQTKAIPEPDPDILLFEVVFTGTGVEEPDMFYDVEKTNPRVKLNFDFNQDINIGATIVRYENGQKIVDKVNIVKPILNQSISLFSNTDELATSKQFISESPTIDLGFKIEEDFAKDTYGNPTFEREYVYYSADVTDEELADGSISIDEADIATELSPNKKWKIADVSPTGQFLIDASILLDLQEGERGNRLVIFSGYKKRLDYIPFIEIPDKDGLVFEVPFSERELERIIEIPYRGLIHANGVEVYIGDADNPKVVVFPNESVGKPPRSKGILRLSYLNDFGGTIGDKFIQINPILVTTDSPIKRGNPISFDIEIKAVDDFPNLLSINRPTTINIPSYGNFDTDYNLKITATTETNYIDVFVEIITNAVKPKLIRLNPKPIEETSEEYRGIRNEFEWSFNIADTLEKGYPAWDKETIKLILIPYSSRKIADPLYSNPNDIKGFEYPLVTQIIKPKIQITLEQVKKFLLDMVIKSVKIESPKENKYISHLANFGNDQQLLISSWENDNWTLSTKTTDEAGNEIVKPEDEVKSVILKLYNPLPQNVQTNSTFWITKLLRNPIVETVILREDIVVESPELKGPNFNIPVNYIVGQSTDYESIDTLILSSSVSSSATLIEQYLSKAAVDTNDLNIQYVSGSISENTAEYLWDNFVHFSSAKERLDNFVYKVQLIEAYESAISSSTYDPTSTGYPLSFTIKQNIELQTEKKNKVLSGFDGFEKFLYTSSSAYTTNSSTSITWPYSNGIRMASTTTAVTGWYNAILSSAEEYDRENLNSLYNNVPSYIKNIEENEQLLLFITMIGQHFDILYFFNKTLERSRSSNYSSKNGIANKLLYDKLKAFNWDAKNLSVNSKLWEYVLGMDSNGNIKQSNPAKERNNEIWRRILNNLPYLLKHKGTKRAIHALMACYGIPSSNLSILEFGGPEINGTSSNKAKFLIENVSTAIKFENGAKITTNWIDTPLSRKPETIETFIKPASAGNWTIISGSGWSLTASGSSSSKYGRVFFKIGSTNYLSSSLLPIFNGDYFGLGISATTGSTNYTFELNVAQSKQERTIFVSSTTASVATGTAGIWQTTGKVAIGSGFSGSVDEFRLWNTALNQNRFFEHVAFPEMTNGNHISSSTEDLFFRLDFDYPKNVSTYTTSPNVDNNIYYKSGSFRNNIETSTIVNGVNIFSEKTPAIYSASFSGFTSITTYPYQFEVFERNSVLEMPDIGVQRYSNNKIRFEDQSLIIPNVLFSDRRNTKRAYDNSPTDSNRLGIFFSPTKELNIDIAKSIGGLNLDNYIGDPRDQYKDTYSSLDTLREYYFNRFDNRDIYAYIDIVKMYEQNLFEDIKQLVPARAKLTTGILIEPHVLERSKIARKKPTGESNQYDTSIDYNIQENVSGENNQYETEIDNTNITTITGESTQYETQIDTIELLSQSAEATQYEGDISTEEIFTTEAEATQYEGEIDSNLYEPSTQSQIDWSYSTFGMSDLENIGLGLYVDEPGVTIRNFIDSYGFKRKDRVRVSMIKRQYTKYFEKYKVRLPNGLGDPKGGTILTSSVFTEDVLSIQPYDGTTTPVASGEIVSVTPVYGYLPTHYKYTQDNSRGLQNSFYYGCKLIGTSPIDGKPVVEEFSSNPNTLVVNKFGRNTNEPILEVE